ncbi:MAG: hypothetical protein A2268_16270 [Candidatus Raymondbacteria bacterium RifOxyA12_full_50_37]|uniref:Uncharacterized protein n=1 Tax=Candidatus Raymondbacteria bacterium RIFOXYD12_FULL_49_13 TaxID=1817890 RepID=A0A1F7F7X5_UNCRA|nr:MAG: hypothetical protein A2268_16270 [Candidatus Raymondbacteria bacterium RifOxyA12_full_50_37]OGJ94353.1 MAG: hypothetical protein A2248_14465 [Candidatus Raymondbacteria bacterium RIFOXYA2_FULL_49_16]OGJ95295.1 MAG: hypothetical protein A2453_05890 [Candidatus Raymondbacteria bacterium RIFOXYC2_FULL_50_21]OGJ99818.1 MAG: hypothetical protein A2487_10800 [Candidatus Raymondbacteria bacterium RifOxyC12_full_50_8]OGK02770.1 MAG: hypothetical protein A2519_07460 [Candidatus Raymondbacteria b
MRVLHLISVRWFNACAQYALDAGLAMRSQGAEVFFSGIAGSPIISAAQTRNFPTVSGIYPNSFNPIKLCLSVVRLRKFIHDNQIDVMVTHRGEDRLLAAAAAPFSRTGLRTIDVRADIRQPRDNPLNRFLYKKIIDTKVVPSLFMKGYYEGFGIGPDMVTVVPQPIDCAGFRDFAPQRNVRSELGLADDVVLTGIVARLDPVKGHRYLMEAANLLSGRPDIKFLVSGEECAVKRTDLEALLRPEARANVFFLPRAADVREILPSLTIGVVASVGSEAICRIGLEMMCFGLPLVATNVHGVPEIVQNGKGGIVVRPRDGHALADAIKQLADDRSKRLRFGRFNEEQARGPFNMKEFGRAWERLCQDTEKKAVRQ